MLEDRPLVSGVMVTGKSPERRSLAMAAITSFRQQTYPHKELVIINDGDSPLLTADLDGVREIRVPQKHTLGELRNLGLHHSRGQFIWQVDDDDWRHPTCLEQQLAAEAQTGSAVLLRYQIRYDAEYNTAVVWKWNYVSVPGIPGTVLHPNRPGLAYRDEGRAEDDHFLQDHFANNIVVLDNSPQLGLSHLYIRFFHGRNTWDRRHVMGRAAGQKNVWSLPTGTAEYLREVLITHYREPLPFVLRR